MPPFKRGGYQFFRFKIINHLLQYRFLTKKLKAKLLGISAN